MPDITTVQRLINTNQELLAALDSEVEARLNLTEELQQAVGQVSVLQSQMDEGLASAAELKIQMDALIESHITLTEERDELKQKLEQEETNSQQLYDECADLEHDLAEVKKELANLKSVGKGVVKAREDCKNAPTQEFEQAMHDLGALSRCAEW